jgi:flagellar biogenesis protein FliO
MTKKQVDVLNVVIAILIILLIIWFIMRVMGV